jgi:hypothetical protein
LIAEVRANAMGLLLRKLLGWLRGLQLPPLDWSYEGEPGGVADRELDGLVPANFTTSTSPPPDLGDGSRPEGTAWVSPESATITSGWLASRTGRAYRRYRTWSELVLLLASGRAPEGLTVGHSLLLAKLRLRSLPAGLSVCGDLDLRQCQRLNRIGDGLVVRGDLLIGGRCPKPHWWEEAWLREAGRADIPPIGLYTLSRDDQCPLAALPPGLRVDGDLRVHNCRRLERLPEDLRVDRSIELVGCTALALLPDPFEVHGDLTIISAPSLTALPAHLSIKGSLRVIGAHIERLPEALTVGGDLILECCPRLTALPEGLAIGGDLIVRRCPIARLPEGLRVGRDLRLHRLRDLEGTPGGLSAPGRIELVRCPALRRIAPGLRVGTNLIVHHCDGLQELPEGLVVPGRLNLRGCTGLERLPGEMVIGSDLGRTPFVPALLLADCPALKSLPDDLTLGGPIEVAGSGLRDLPERLSRSVRILWRGVVVPPEVVFRPETLTPEQILDQRNAELRRVILERLGLEEVLRQAKAEIVDSDRDPGGDRRLVRIRLPGRPARAPDRRYLHCRCPSTGREYLLRVPPETRTCGEAAAWLAGFDDPEAYRPVQET